MRRYGPDGDWAKLFARAPGYLGTELLRDRGSRDHFLTVDRWQDEEAFERFRRDFREEYARIDRECECLVLCERSLGAYDSPGQRRTR